MAFIIFFLSTISSILAQYGPQPPPIPVNPSQQCPQGMIRSEPRLNMCLDGGFYFNGVCCTIPTPKSSPRPLPRSSPRPGSTPKSAAPTTKKPVASSSNPLPLYTQRFGSSPNPYSQAPQRCPEGMIMKMAVGKSCPLGGFPFYSVCCDIPPNHCQKQQLQCPAGFSTSPAYNGACYTGAFYYQGVCCTPIVE